VEHPTRQNPGRQFPSAKHDTCPASHEPPSPSHGPPRPFSAQSKHLLLFGTRSKPTVIIDIINVFNIPSDKNKSGLSGI
jgi:hypothetical protein